MKKYALIGITGLISFGSFAQKLKEKEVPTAVVSTFHKQFPQAKELKWEKENGNYEVEFDLNKTETSALFDGTGKLLETETEIQINQLPDGILSHVKANYKGQKIKEAAKITDSNGVVMYEAEIKGKDLIFDANGIFIKELDNH